MFSLISGTWKSVRESFSRGPCTPFDPAQLGLALHEAQGEELISAPVFITAGLKRTVRTI